MTRNIEKNSIRELLKKRVDEVVETSTLPSILRRIIAVVEDENSTRAALEEVISHDQTLASKVVEISNNAFYGFSGRINSIHGAIKVIGFDLTKTLAVSTAVFTNLPGTLLPEITKLWIHSFAVAETATRLSEITGHGNRAVTFTAGLLHDIGRPLFFQLFGTDYLNKTKAIGEKNLVELEIDLFEAAHTEVGTWFAEKCSMPKEIVSTILYHHSPELYEAATGPHYPYLVYLADLVVEDGKGVPGEYNAISPKHAAIMEELGLDGDKLDALKEEVATIEEVAEKYFTQA